MSSDSAFEGHEIARVVLERLTTESAWVAHPTVGSVNRMTRDASSSARLGTTDLGECPSAPAMTWLTIAWP